MIEPPMLSCCGTAPSQYSNDRLLWRLPIQFTGTYSGPLAAQLLWIGWVQSTKYNRPMSSAVTNAKYPIGCDRTLDDHDDCRLNDCLWIVGDGWLLASGQHTGPA